MTNRLAPNVELLFTEHGDYPDRVRAAAAAGFTSVEMWGPTGKDAPARPKDLGALKAALEETGVRLEAQLAEPRTQFMIPPKDHTDFYRGIEEGARIAQDLGCPRIVVQGGTGFGGRKRQDQLDELAGIYTRAVASIEGSGVVLTLEAVNTRVDHPGTLLDRTSDAVEVARQVGSPAFGVLLDVYHSRVMDEDLATVLAEAGRFVEYVQIADAPGRGEPGSGAIDWPQTFATLARAGYDGPIGLEYLPTVASEESTRFVRKVLENL